MDIGLLPDGLDGLSVEELETGPERENVWTPKEALRNKAF